MIPNITFLIAAFVITIMAKLLTDKDTNATVAILAMLTIIVALLVSYTTFTSSVKIGEVINSHSLK